MSAAERKNTRTQAWWYARGAEVAADWDDLRTPESYLGLARTEHFSSPSGAVRCSPRVYSAPAQLPLNS
jgi:hypothetical protein